jgi:hypothetical protein
MKRYTGELHRATFSSWQFKRGTQDKKGGSKKQKDDQADLEDIGYTDVIGQISSISIGLFQDDGIETMLRRNLRVLKGRNGEIGQFSAKWDFMGMDFSQCDPPLIGQGTAPVGELQWV